MYRSCLRVLLVASRPLSTRVDLTRCCSSHGYQHYNRTNSNSSSSRYTKYLLGTGVVAGGTVVAGSKQEEDNDPEGEEVDIPDDIVGTRYRRTRMFKHFCSFSSLKYKNELFMTGDDFLKAILNKETRTNNTRHAPLRVLSKDEYQEILYQAPEHTKETRGMFRGLGECAVISYPEYLFLVSILSKPKDHFLKTFQLIDVDGNWVLTKQEFELIEKLFSSGVVEESPLNTTLKVHFFKMDGSGFITFEDFSHFLDSLQKECLELEFNEYSHGQLKITDTDFTRILLSRTTLGDMDKDRYLKRVAIRNECTDNGVTFTQYSQFMNLLNDIHDLEIALRMFQIAKKPVTPDEFQRAVRVCTGSPLDVRLVQLTFKIFDDDGDGALAHTEFMKVMRDRIRNRGTVEVMIPPNSWKAFRKCVYERMLLTS